MKGSLKGIGVLALLIALALPRTLAADAGVLIPKNISDRPDPGVLALHQMNVTVQIEGQYARVRAVQIFRNLTTNEIEGSYMFTLPDKAQVSNFAIWEDGTRIPGVVVERKRAREIYEELTYMKIDPGLLESGGIDSRNIFKVDVYPIPSMGTKRIEIEYTEALDVDSLRSRFAFPLKPNLYGEQSCAHFKLDFSFKSSFPVAEFQQTGNTMPLERSADEPRHIAGSFTAEDISFTEDFAVEYRLDVEQTRVESLTYRKPERRVDLSPIGGGNVIEETDGYVASQVVFNARGGSAVQAPRDIMLLVDTSLSMQWDKLERTYEALEFFLRNLPESDRFSLLTFNEEVRAFADDFRTADNGTVGEALSFFRSGYLMGGTDLAAALRAGLERFNAAADGRERFLVLITDGGPTLGQLNAEGVLDAMSAADSRNVRTMVFGIGNDTNVSLLERIAETGGGHFAWTPDTGDTSFMLQTFLDKLGETMITGLSVLFRSGNPVTDVYADTRGSAFDRSMVTWIGTYAEPGSTVVELTGRAGDEALFIEAKIELPALATEADMLPRRWAKLRVDHLLRSIEEEDDPSAVEGLIDEVVALAKRYNFVTPYTSFLAAPRSLLRPRAIRPGDPVLRVRTHESIRSVVALFPFGLTKPLHYIADEDVWETRFLAPKEMRDGTYACTLLLTDEEGSLYEEEKEFVIDSKPPTLKLQTDREVYAAGEAVHFRVNADRDTRRIQIRIGDLAPVEARYRTALGASEAIARLPLDMKPGTYDVRVSAVDFARNTALLETTLRVEASAGGGQ